MVTCELCGRQFKNSQGLRGHKTFKHGIYASSNTPAGKSDALHPLSKLGNRVELLEQYTGINASSVVNNAGTLPLGEKLMDTVKQVDSFTTQWRRIDERNLS